MVTSVKTQKLATVIFFIGLRDNVLPVFRERKSPVKLNTQSNK